MSGTEGKGAKDSVLSLQDAPKVVAEAAGTVAIDRLRAEVDARSSRIAVEVKAFAVGMRASSVSLRDQGHEAQADLMSELARRADRLASRLATADTDELVDDAKRLTQEAAAFARREPALVIAGALALGLLAPKVVDIVSKGTLTDTTREEPT
jgi:hypothetical protein